MRIVPEEFWGGGCGVGSPSIDFMELAGGMGTGPSGSLRSHPSSPCLASCSHARANSREAKRFLLSLPCLGHQQYSTHWW